MNAHISCSVTYVHLVLAYSLNQTCEIPHALPHNLMITTKLSEHEEYKKCAGVALSTLSGLACLASSLIKLHYWSKN